MELKSRLTSVRSPVVLIKKPSLPTEYWITELAGLSKEHITQATNVLRTEHAPKQRVNGTDTKDAKSLADEPTLKVSGLHKSFANALGATNQDEWRRIAEHELPAFMDRHGLITPAHLIAPPPRAKRMAVEFNARELADRLFNSTNPPPKRIYTGVEGQLFRFSPVDTAFIGSIATSVLAQSRMPGHLYWDEAISLINERGNQKVFDSSGFESEFRHTLPDGSEASISADELLSLTWRDVLFAGGELNDMALEMLSYLASRHRLLFDGVIGPLREDAEKIDGSSDTFSVLREALIDDVNGWVDVIPFNDNICFLKGSDGKFDWLIRDQRSEMLSANPLYPILEAKELPAAQRQNFNSWYYYQTGRSMHDDHIAASQWQHRHGDFLVGERNFLAVIEHYLISTGEYRVVGHRKSLSERDFNAPQFYTHRNGPTLLQVSELITTEQFRVFLNETDWLNKREARANRDGIRLGPIAPHFIDEDLPVGVAYYDAVAYCGWLQKKIGVPTRLLSPQEWNALLPKELTQRYDELKRRSPLQRNVTFTVGRRKQHAAPSISSNVVACEYNGQLVHHDALPLLDQETYAAIPVRFFRDKIKWARNEAGLPFLDGRSFGEWLDSLYSGHAPAVCAAYGMTLQGNPLTTADHAIYSTYKHHSQKIGFRVCFTPRLDG